MITNKKIKIYLCDLVHHYLGVSTSMFPLNIGYLTAYANKIFPKDLDFELFKYPQDIITKTKTDKPDIVGFAHYTWNADINKRIAAWIKSIYPETVVIFGGPNITYSESGYKNFFSRIPSADFYMPYQGETPFVNFLREALDKELKIDALKVNPIDGVISFDKKNKRILEGEKIPRIKKLDEIPSPYLTGILDKFFDTNLIPIVESNRGCPYTCTFCAQGVSSYNNLDFFDIEIVRNEISYIASHIKNANILQFADANFGIVKRDIEIAENIAQLTQKTGYPRKFFTNWAKNQPELFRISKIIKSSILVVSLQTLNDKVLENVKRKNIKSSIFKDIMNKVNASGGRSGTEIILGLPGETKATHQETLRGLFDWNISYILCYNALILEGTEMFDQREKGELQCTSKFRLIDNSFGKYDNILSFEYEEGIRSLSTISEEEILYFRPVHWLIQFLWNYRFYYDVLKYLQALEINPLDYILKVLDNFKKCSDFEELKNIFKEFEEEASSEWFDSPEMLYKHYSQEKNLKDLKDGQYGKMNGKYIFKILLEAKESFHSFLHQTAVSFLPSEKMREPLNDIFNFLSATTIDFTQKWDEILKERTVYCHYDILSWRNSRYEKSLEEFYCPQGMKFIFCLPEKQQQSLQTLFKQYKHKNPNVTLRKMSEYMEIRDFFRKATIADRQDTPEISDRKLENSQ